MQDLRLRKQVSLQRALLRWSRRHPRRMDWRETDDPYRIWVSEIMLQQTRASTVTPYYRRLVAEFPTPEALARAPLDAILKSWEGLGYYSRARNLHKAARIVVALHGGRLPSSVEELTKLPGIGRSTAGAIAAIAFRRDEPILDANVKRVVARLHAVREDLRKAPVERALWEFSRRMILPGKGRETALAMMDLGSTVCTPKAPKCAVCPVASWCGARRLGIQGSIPRKSPANCVPHRERGVAVIRDGRGRILVRRRPESGMLGGLWELPGCDGKAGEPLEKSLAKALRKEAGIGVEIRGGIGVIEHAFSHLRVTHRGYRCRKSKGRTPSSGGWKWAAPAELETLAMPRADRKLLEQVGKKGGSRKGDLQIG